jgi:predicted nuclease of predicted toxin-antitoxin system
VKLRFQADNDLDQRIVVAAAAGLHHMPDPEVLALAAADGRVLVSHDRRTLPRHFAEFVASQNSPGLIVVSRKLPVGRAAELLHLLWAASEAEEYVNVVYDLP